MITFPNAKINLGLRVLRKRPDGFHDIETIFYPIGLTDALEIVPSDDGKLSFALSGMALTDGGGDNLCVRAFRLMQQRYNLPEVKIFLHKTIPAGAGLGGGSSDAAFTLKLVRRLFGLKVSDDELKGMAAALGSDCPFFIENIPSFASGRGEVMQELPLTLKGKHLLLVKPDVAISTPWAYGAITPSGESLPAVNLLFAGSASWNHLLKNDFEAVVMEKYPVVKEIRDKMTEAGAFYAAMSGSGSSVFGLFDEKPTLGRHDFEGMFVWQEVLQ